MRAFFAVLVLCAASLISFTSAQADEPLDTARTIIQNQIKAFLQGDSDTAYSFAAPGIKALFPNKDLFFAMVKKSYEPVYHPGNYAFGRGAAVADGAMVYQEVLISGQDGKDWTAVYQISRQPDGSYKINGVQILPNTESKGI
jgi:hypothetical protein